MLDKQIEIPWLELRVVLPSSSKLGKILTSPIKKPFLLNAMDGLHTSKDMRLGGNFLNRLRSGPGITVWSGIFRELTTLLVFVNRTLNVEENF